MRGFLFGCWSFVLFCACAKPRTVPPPPPEPSAPQKPAHLRAEVLGQSVSLRWEAIKGARKYHMQWARETAPRVLLGQASITTPELTVTDLEQGLYIFRVAEERPEGPGPMETITAQIP